jgi:thioredoxin-related protein
MRISLLTLCLLVLVNFTSAQTTFNDYSWKELLKKAETEEKLIFIDAYTDWCGWCKVMDKNTFSDSAVGELMNTRFVNTKLEMEKSKLGSQLAMKYAINGFPTFLVLNAKGKMVYSIEGYREAENFIAELNKALDESNQLKQPGYSSNLNEPYPNFYKNAFGNGKKKQYPDSLTVANYLNTHSIENEVTWQVAKRFYSLMAFEHVKDIAQHKDKIIELFGKAEYYDFLISVVNNKVYKAQQDSNIEAAKTAVAFGSEYGNFTERNKNEAWLFYYRGNSDFENAALYFEKVKADTGKISASYINDLAWDIFLKCDNLTIIKKAIQWIDEIPASEMEWNIMDTQASLLYKSNQSERAAIMAQKAIETAKQKGENAKDTEALLEKIIKSK